MTILFISDLHLCAERTRMTALFLRFLENIAPRASALYILGDLFEYWIGDDQLDHDPLARGVAAGIKSATDRGTAVFFMHGNRDFLIGARFAKETGLTILPDPTIVDLGGQRAVLMHGDTLCTDDIAYQQFRTQVRTAEWQRDLLQKSYAARDALARSLRSQSDVEKSMKAEAIMDVNTDAVSRAFAEHDVPLLIHGHTHRPAMHQVRCNESPSAPLCTRWVLPDWHQKGGYLKSDGGTLSMHFLA